MGEASNLFYSKSDGTESGESFQTGYYKPHVTLGSRVYKLCPTPRPQLDDVKVQDPWDPLGTSNCLRVASSRRLESMTSCVPGAAQIGAL